MTRSHSSQCSMYLTYNTVVQLLNPEDGSVISNATVSLLSHSYVVVNQIPNELHHKKICFLLMGKKVQISHAVTAQLINPFVFTTKIVQFTYFINPKFQAYSHLLWLYSLVCVGPCRTPQIIHYCIDYCLM